jgi:rSAM/selenodomain-associated transferase 1
MPSTVWIQFVKMPELGRVKTRLAATLGDESALEAHKTLARQVNRQLVNFIKQQAGWSEQSLWLGLGTTSVSDAASFDASCKVFSDLGLTFDRAFFQTGEGLGERMTEAIVTGLRSADRMFIVGSDFPVLDPDYCLQAVAALDDADVVLGSTEDGGYGLIGLKKTGGLSAHMSRECDGFGAVEWGTDAVRAQTKDNLESKGLRVALLPARFDVDTEEDWKRWRASAWCSDI